MIAHDARTLELCRTNRVPVVHASQIREPITGSNVKSLFDFDATAFDANRREMWGRYEAILRGADRSAFSGRGGETIVVEGRVTGFGETRFRTYLNFGPIRTVDFAVTFARQGLKNLETAGLQPASLEGKTLRVRGLLDTRFGPQIEIVEPAAIEILTDSAAPPQSRPLARR